MCMQSRFAAGSVHERYHPSPAAGKCEAAGKALLLPCCMLMGDHSEPLPE